MLAKLKGEGNPVSNRVGVGGGWGGGVVKSFGPAIFSCSSATSQIIQQRGNGAPEYGDSILAD